MQISKPLSKQKYQNHIIKPLSKQKYQQNQITKPLLKQKYQPIKFRNLCQNKNINQSDSETTVKTKISTN
jgi:hypothetical protein